jgi:hypothetical protein
VIFGPFDKYFDTLSRTPRSPKMLPSLWFGLTVASVPELVEGPKRYLFIV